jgi:hypothetical protein
MRHALHHDIEMEAIPFPFAQLRDMRPRLLVTGHPAVKRSAACSECAWKFNPSGRLVGRTLQEMKQRYEIERDKEFESHVCAAHPREKKSSF